MTSSRPLTSPSPWGAGCLPGLPGEDLPGLGLALLAAATLPAAASPGTNKSGVAANSAFGIQNNVLAAGLEQSQVAYGQPPLNNPNGGISHYGYNTSNGGPLTQDAKEACKTEPDKRVYLTFDGKHYLFQGHEGGPQGYVTRVDLDEPDLAKRASLVADTRSDGAAVPSFDGITWDPFTHQPLLTAEAAAPKGGVFGITLDDDGNPVDGKIVPLPRSGPAATRASGTTRPALSGW